MSLDSTVTFLNAAKDIAVIIFVWSYLARQREAPDKYCPCTTTEHCACEKESAEAVSPEILELLHENKLGEQRKLGRQPKVEDENDEPRSPPSLANPTQPGVKGNEPLEHTRDERNTRFYDQQDSAKSARLPWLAAAPDTTGVGYEQSLSNGGLWDASQVNIPPRYGRRSFWDKFG